MVTNPFARRATPQLELELAAEVKQEHESTVFETLGELLGFTPKAEPNTGAAAAVVIDKMFNDGVAHLPASTTTRMSKRRARRLRGKAKAAA